MDEFEMLCRQLAQATAAQRQSLMDSCMARLVPTLQTIGLDTEETLTLFASFMISAAYADGVIKTEEYNAIYPAIKNLFGEYVDFETASGVIDEFAADQAELKQKVKNIIAMLGQRDETAQMDAVTICLAICAADGNVSEREKAFLAEILE